MSETNINITTVDAVVTTTIATGNTDAAQSGAVADAIAYNSKNYLLDKSLTFTANELIMIDAILDVRCMKVPPAEDGDTFGIIALNGSAHGSAPFRILIRNIDTGATVFDTFVSAGTVEYKNTGFSVVSTKMAGTGTHEFMILIDWNKIPSSFSFLDSLTQVTFTNNSEWTSELSRVQDTLSFPRDVVGKNWSVWGDSISATSGYWREGANQYLNMTMDIGAVSGDLIADQTDDLATLISGTPTYFEDKAMVSLMAIYNTWTGDYALGVSTDSTATASYCGKLKYFIETVLTSNKFSRIVLMTQYITETTANGNGDTLMDFNEKTREIAELYSIPVVEWANESGCNSLNAGTATSPQYDRQFFTQDGVHTGRIGGTILYKMFVNTVLQKINTFF